MRRDSARPAAPPGALHFIVTAQIVTLVAGMAMTAKVMTEVAGIMIMAITIVLISVLVFLHGPMVTITVILIPLPQMRCSILRHILNPL